VHQVLTFTRRPEGSPFSGFVRLGAYLPEHINLVIRYGPYYLTRAEYQRRLAALLARYGLFLLGRLGKLANPDFRAYHLAATQRIARAAATTDVLAGIMRNLRRILETQRLRLERG
jgi:hypothetical protein